ncbi:MAG: sulfatase-like hydrolase/transferase [Chloroflexi bacterium]|nr:sulfatase-like hydrolase/transferase [Chloroflexota bacterium]
MIDRLWLRLALGMAVAVVVAVAAVAVLANRGTGEGFREYVADTTDARAKRVESVLSRHFARYGDWTHADATVQLMADLTGQRVVLADTRGRIVSDSQGRLVGQYVQPSWQGDPIIISFQEHPAGSVYLDPLRGGSRVDQRGQSFLAASNTLLLWAVAVGLAAALVTSLVLARWLARPLESLTRAVRRMEEGKIVEPIDVKIGGEIGALARAFNTAAASISRVEGLRKQMVADIAHELRTPLTNVRGYFEAIEDGVMEPAGETLEIIRHELGQLTRLLDDLQELALAESGQLTLEGERTELGELVAWEVRTLRPMAEHEGVDLQLDIAHALPALVVDRGRIGQVLRNVLRNALSHTPRGGHILVSVNEDGPDAVLRIRDSGSGIAPEHLPHIFERFYRGDRSRSRQGGGYGLGLTIAREIVVAHGGTIVAESELGKGTTFTIRLPIATALPGEAEQPVPAPVEHPPARVPVLLRVGVGVGAMFGALAGVFESVLVSMTWTSHVVSEVIGYAVLIDGIAFALLGGLLAGIAGLLTRLTQRTLSAARATALWTPICCLLVGLLIYSRWKQLVDPRDVLMSPQLIFSMVIIMGLAAWVAVLCGAILEPRAGNGHRALVFSGRVAPIAVALVAGLASVSVARDFGSHAVEAASADSRELPVAVPSPSLAANASPAPAARPQLPSLVQRAPNVVLISVEGLRSDHVGYQGYMKARTPTLDRLAAEGVSFTNGLTQAPSGGGAHASLMTGTYLSTNGLREPLIDLLPPGLPTLAEVLASRGYATSGVYSWLSYEPSYSGLERGFQAYTDVMANRPAYLADHRASTFAATVQRLKTFLALPSALNGGPALPDDVLDQQSYGQADVTTATALEWLGTRRNTAQPFFLWAHYFDPRYPWDPPASFDQPDPDSCVNCLEGVAPTIKALRSDSPPELSPPQIDRLIELYDGEIAFTDHEIGRLLQGLGNLGLAQNTLVIVVGSQGQSFGEHGSWLDGRTLYDPEVHVPIIVNYPGRLPAQRLDGVAQLADIMPTVLDALGIKIPVQVEGRSLLPVIRGQESGSDRVAVSELPDGSGIAIETSAWKLIRRTQDRRAELYRLEDPDELEDVSDLEPDVVAELSRLLDDWSARHRAAAR